MVKDFDGFFHIRNPKVWDLCSNLVSNQLVLQDGDWENSVTDTSEHLELMSAYASFSLNPFEDIWDAPRAFCGIIEYKLV
mmetsp:Transcript_47828/g.74668  ORF Transcript_47828/g.74668 Transcript_47828/m.74668 type:complete len:80 (-) Transcript_47828:255-494(-)